jgi:uncharacterized cupin superfamily protein
MCTLVRSADTAGAVVLLQVTLPAYWDACAPHWHVHTTELLYVVHGTLAWSLDDTTTTASRGTMLLIPPGGVHTIWNPIAACDCCATRRAAGHGSCVGTRSRENAPGARPSARARRHRVPAGRARLDA